MAAAVQGRDDNSRADILIRTEPGKNNSAANDPESEMAWEEERRVIIVGVA